MCALQPLLAPQPVWLIVEGTGVAVVSLRPLAPAVPCLLPCCIVPRESLLARPVWVPACVPPLYRTGSDPTNVFCAHLHLNKTSTWPQSEDLCAVGSCFLLPIACDVQEAVGAMGAVDVAVVATEEAGVSAAQGRSRTWRADPLRCPGVGARRAECSLYRGSAY